MEINNYIVLAIGVLLLIGASISLNISNKCGNGEQVSQDETNASKVFNIASLAVGVVLITGFIMALMVKRRTRSA